MKNNIDMFVPECNWSAFRKEAAMMAMQGLLANSSLFDIENCDYHINIVSQSVRFADDLIEELKK